LTETRKEGSLYKDTTSFYSQKKIALNKNNLYLALYYSTQLYNALKCIRLGDG